MNAPEDWIGAAGLPSRWRDRERFVVFEAGAEGAQTLTALHRAWRDDTARCAQLHVIVVDADMAACGVRGERDADAEAGFAAELASAWPPCAPNLHRLAFDGGAFVALLVPMALREALVELVGRFDLFHLTERACAGLSDRRAMKAFGRLAAPGAVLLAEALNDALRAGLVTAGFRFEAAGTVAHFEPRPALSPSRRSVRDAREPELARRAIVIGAGLAGCATAWALAEGGWKCTLVDSRRAIAAEASGNPAGLFHGIFNRHDGTHARFNRAAAMEATKAVRIAIDSHGVQGAIDGVLRREGDGADPREMQAAIDALGLPAEYIEALDARQMSAAAGIALSSAGWLYRSGGWVDPAGLARSFIERAGMHVALRLGVHVVRLRRVDPSWQLLDAEGAVIDRCETVILANASDAMRLSATLDAGDLREPLEVGSLAWPIARVRGQVSVMARSAWPHGEPPLRPLTGSGYVVAIEGDRVMFGATSHSDDGGQDDFADGGAHAHIDDHLINLKRLESWVPGAATIAPSALQGRTAWRAVAQDRLPVIGGVPAMGSTTAIASKGRGTSPRLDQPRLVPRERGLFVFTALGSRGITWAALGAETLASIVIGSPCPIEASLLDAVDPARFVSRLARARGGSTQLAGATSLDGAPLAVASPSVPSDTSDS